ncbi:MAG: hypothetical protein IPQ04_04530 [Saprospiraceae bacterium]|nr:hypothetical protein [Saprospiraceae bacterium]
MNGQSPYTISSTSGVVVGQNISMLSAGSYNFTVTDNLGCSVVGIGVVPQTVAPTATAQADSSSCGMMNGRITVNASGVNGPMQYTIGRSLTEYECVWQSRCGYIRE